MAPRAFKPVDVENALAELTLDEKTRLLAGVGWVSLSLILGRRMKYIVGTVANTRR